jgi:hypothetical protein
VIDGPVMVQRLQPGLSATFTDYAQTVVMPYNIRQQSIKYTRIDIVYDVYYKISIKMQQEKSVEEGLVHCNRPGKDSQRLESFPQ